MPPSPGQPDPTPRDSPAGKGLATTGHSQRERWLLRAVTALAILLLIGGTSGFLWHERQRTLDEARDLAVRQVARLAQDMEQSLALARVTIEQAESRLLALRPGSLANTSQAEAAAERAALLSKLPLPFELHALDRDGQVLGLVSPTARAGMPSGVQASRPTGALKPGHWQVGNAAGPPQGRKLPLVWSAVPNPHGITAYEAAFSFNALLDRLEADRAGKRGGAGVFRIEHDGSVTVLARAPFAESELGRTLTLRTPWVQALATSRQGVARTHSPLDGIQRQVAFQRLDRAADSLVIAYGVADQDALASWSAQLPAVLAGALLLALGMAYGGWRLDRSLRDLSRSEQRYQSLANHLPDVVMRLDPEGRFLFINAAIEAANGMRSDEVVGRTVAEVGMSTEQAAEWLACIQRVLGTQQADTLCFTHPGPRGVRHWETRIAPEPRPPGEEPSVLAISRDTTETQEAGDVLQRSEQKLREAQRLARLGHWELDLHSGALIGSDELFRIFGIETDPAGVGFESLMAQIHPEDRDAVSESFRRSVTDHQPYSFTHRLQLADGQIRHVHERGETYYDTEGTPLRTMGTVQDISERQMLEEVQRQTLHQLDTVANASSALFWSCDLAMQTDWVNRRWLEFTGHSLAEELGQGWTSGIHPDDRERCASVYAQVREQGQPFGLEYRLRHRDGSYRWMLEQGQPRRDADGHLIGYIGSCIDLTDMKAAEQVAAQQRLLLDRVFEVLPDLFFLMDADGTILDYKASQRSALYVPPDRFLGRRMQDVLPPDIARQFLQAQEQARSGGLLRYTYTLTMADGPHSYDARVARLPQSEQLMAVIRDITEQQQLEAERERLNRFIVLLFRLASDFINLPLERMDTEIDQALGEMGEFVGADRAYLFSYRFDLHAGSNTHEWCAPGIAPEKEHLQDLTLDLIPDWVQTHLRGDILHVPDVQGLPAGALREVLEPQGIQSLITLPLMSQGGCLGFVGFDSVREPHAYDDEELGLLRLFAQMLVNVYERHAAENRLHQLTAELEERVRDRTQRLDASVRGLRRANAELEAFTYSVSHDLKSPLRSLEGFCTLLLEEHARHLDAEGQDYLGRIQRAARHMAQLINGMLAYSRLEQQEQSLRGLPLAGLVDSVLEGMRNELDLRTATVRVAIAQDLLVRAAPEGLAMVLRNLIDNALKFRRPEQPPAIDITAHAQGDTIQLTVRDNGQGFEMQYHDRIFALFQRLHRADQVPGTGLGLAMVHKAVERMEGRIWAESTPGQGSAFHIELPRA